MSFLSKSSNSKRNFDSCEENNKSRDYDSFCSNKSNKKKSRKSSDSSFLSDLSQNVLHTPENKKNKATTLCDSSEYFHKNETQLDSFEKKLIFSKKNSISSQPNKPTLIFDVLRRRSIQVQMKKSTQSVTEFNSITSNLEKNKKLSIDKFKSVHNSPRKKSILIPSEKCAIEEQKEQRSNNSSFNSSNEEHLQEEGVIKSEVKKNSKNTQTLALHEIEEEIENTFNNFSKKNKESKHINFTSTNLVPKEEKKESLTALKQKSVQTPNIKEILAQNPIQKILFEGGCGCSINELNDNRKTNKNLSSTIENCFKLRSLIND